MKHIGRRSKKRERRKKRFCAGFCIGLVLCVMIFAFQLNLDMQPLLTKMVTAKAQAMSVSEANEAANTVLRDAPADYSSLVTLQTDTYGKVTGLTTNSTEVNQLKIAIVEETARRLEDSQIAYVKIPVGSFIGNEMLSGRGPKIKIKFQTTSMIYASVEHSFESKGINQTRHQIVLTMRVTVTAIIKGYEIETQTESSFPLAETVIVGAAPESFANLEGIID